MGKEPRKRVKKAQVAVSGAPPVCPHCGTAEPMSADPTLVLRLIESHTELCNALRLAGREILRLDNGDSESLQRIRDSLKKAESMRTAFRNAYPLPRATSSKARKMPKKSGQRAMTGTSVSELSDQEVSHVRGGSSKRSHHLTRPNSHRILKFPARAEMG
jgi:hypothetical protein